MHRSAWPLPFWIAHRGAGKLAPENTLAAFREGAGLGYRAFECDVKLSADGVPYLLHDATLDRCTCAQGSAAGWTWSALSRLDAGAWHSPDYAGEPPASLEAVSRFCRAKDLALNLELKPLPGQAHATGATVARAVQGLWQNAAAPVLLSSFEVAALEGALSSAPLVPRALLVDTLEGGWQQALQALHCAALIAHYPLVDAELVAQVHAQQRRVLVYTCNDPEAAASLLALGVDGIITDALDRFTPTPEPTLQVR
ncbi:glycerophosphodiester phosphodiesterase [Roseateles sp. BYS180W]|uniref:Glycerophosphodiester phosphodiesterase n=1 Tax=Roseateles rivi TaxID=3299028 RepID=A0ABW7FXH3_9BURK